MTKSTVPPFESYKPALINRIKVHILKSQSDAIFRHFKPKLDFVYGQYVRCLPYHVAQNEKEDLLTVAKLELLESIKTWNPDKLETIWPLAYQRINGAMKDHIRYITKSDPTQFYNWVKEAADVLIGINRLSDFEAEIETGSQLADAMKVLTPKEKRIVILHAREDKTFSEISKEISLSESQISRIYKKAVEKIKKNIS